MSLMQVDKTLGPRLRGDDNHSVPDSCSRKLARRTIRAGSGRRKITPSAIASTPAPISSNTTTNTGSNNAKSMARLRLWHGARAECRERGRAFVG